MAQRKKFMTVREVMDETGWSERLTRAIGHRPDAPVIYNGNRVLFLRDMLDDYCKQLAREQAQISE